MRVEYINPFVESAFNVLKEYVGNEVKRGEIGLTPSMTIMGVAAMVGLAGDVEGRVLIDMTLETALKVAGSMNSERDDSKKITNLVVFNELDDLAKGTIQELANMITGQAVSRLHELGFKFDLTPPALFTGYNLEVTNLGGVEALVVPVELGPNGTIVIKVAIREKAK
ncbi:MAG: chemotaxis protein CheX [Treponema sp.]|jgi:chemotaxis protein CheX|nr:chemotaxis protein CheX [Treponema sp.]